MKMKKIICSLMIAVLCFMTAISGVSAANTYDTNKLLDAADKVKAYYKANGLSDTNYLDEIIAYEALGGEAEDDLDISKFESNIYASDVGSLSKGIIVAKLLKKDPTNLTINGSQVNLVSELESKIDENGCFGTELGNNIDIWGLLTLETVSSSKVQQVANHIASDINPDGGFWNYGWKQLDPSDPNSKWVVDTSAKNSTCDVTGWGIEALSIAGKKQYSSTIQKAIGYLKGQQNDVGFTSYGAVNPDTQACAIEGLSVYNRNDLLNGVYDKNNSNQIDVLLNYQNTDTGSFWYYNVGEENGYATQDAARAIGTIINGSVIYKAIGYGNPDTTLTRKEETKPAQNPTQTENKKDSQAPKKDQSATAVKTGDNTNVAVFVSLSMISGGLFLVLRKENEKAC